MLDENKLLFTGGSGLLGTEIRRVVPRAHFPTHEEFDVANLQQMDSYLEGKDLGILFHAAAFTSPPKIDEDPLRAIETNIVGTSNIVRLCVENNLRLIYVSTDYVFSGEEGNYSEQDPVSPVNTYAWSKLGGECAVRLYDNSLIIRTSFGENEFPYEKAFVDHHTSRLSVSDLVGKIIPLLDSDLMGVIHLGSERRTVKEYAESLNPEREIGDLFRGDVAFEVPKDTSLNCGRYNRLFGEEK